jgi:hypothetical protein
MQKNKIGTNPPWNAQFCLAYHFEMDSIFSYRDLSKYLLHEQLMCGA